MIYYTIEVDVMDGDTVKDERREQIFGDEMVAKILETEQYMESHPDEWISSDEFFAELNRTLNE